MLRVATLCLLPFVLCAQDATLTLAGSVVDSQTGEPLPRALVRIQGFVAPSATSPGSEGRQVNRTAMTDASGAFRFSTLPPATYIARAQKPGFGANSLASGQFARVELKSSEEGVRISLTALGVITGKVVDQNAAPMRGVGIQALSSSVNDGLRQPRVDRTVTTDDRGAYRIWDLSPGKYYLKATGQGGGNGSFDNQVRLDVGDSFAPIYSDGGQTMDSAKPVEIGAATHATADFHLKLEPAWRIDGVLRNYTPGQGVTFALVIGGEEVPAGPDRFNRETGAFEFKDVVPGSYVLRATQDDKTGETAVSVAGADADSVVVALYPPADIPVTVRFTNAPPEPPKPGLLDDPDDAEDLIGAPRDECNISLRTEPSNGSVRPPTFIFAKDGYLRKVPSGKQLFSIRCFGGYVRSALAGTQDLLANPVLTIAPGSVLPPIEILATHGGGTITGNVEDRLLGSRQLQIVMVPQFSGSPGPEHQQGDFSFRNIAPGRYMVYAFAHSDIEYRNPAFLQSLSGGQSVQIDGDETKEITIDKVIP